MNGTVYNAAREFVERARAAGQTRGRLADPEEWERLNRDVGGRIPAWYAALLATVPLCGLELGWQASEPEGDYDGVEWLAWHDPHNMRSEMLEVYPGLVILERGYINVAGDPMGGGDQFFMPADAGDDPPVFHIYHDVGTDADTILAEGRVPVAASLSELFRTAKPE